MEKQPIESNNNCSNCQNIKAKVLANEAVSDLVLNAWNAGNVIQRNGIFSIQYPNTTFSPKIDFLKKLNATQHKQSKWCKQCGILVSDRAYMKEVTFESTDYIELCISFYQTESIPSKVSFRLPNDISFNSEQTNLLYVYQGINKTYTINKDLDIYLNNTKKGKINIDKNIISIDVFDVLNTSDASLSILLNKENLLKVSNIDNYDVMQVATYDSSNNLIENYFGYIKLNSYSTNIDNKNDVDSNFGKPTKVVVPIDTYKKALYVWGKNQSYQLGVKNNNYVKDPIKSYFSSKISKVSSKKDFTLAIDEDKNLYVWGSNEYGKLGFNDSFNRTEPTKLNLDSYNIKGITDISTGWYHSVIVDSNKYVWTFGRNNVGQLGNGTTTNNYVLQQVKTNEDKQLTISKVSSNSNFTLALDESGYVWKWGGSKVIDGTNTIYSQATKTTTKDSGEFKANNIAAGGYHSLAIKSDQTVWSLGYNDSGQLGIPSTDNEGYQDTEKLEYIKWIQIASLTSIVSVGAGLQHSVAIDGSKNVWAWGDNNYGQIGNGQVSTIGVFNPTKITKSIPYIYKVDVDVNGNWSFTPSEDLNVESYTVYIYVDGEYGVSNKITHELDISTSGETKTSTVKSSTPNASNILISLPIDTVSKTPNKKPTISGNTTGTRIGDKVYLVFEINSFSNIEKVACGENTNIAIDTDKNLWVWGNNESKLFPIDNKSILYPTKIPNQKDIIDVVLGDNNVFYIKNEKV